MPKTGEVYRPEGKDKHSGWVGRYTYTIQGSDIEVAIFVDMLEITSPGPFPDTLAPDALGTGHAEIRSRVLASIFKTVPGIVET
jgi:predicted HTH transcriptional regulator